MAEEEQGLVETKEEDKGGDGFDFRDDQCCRND